MFQYKVFVIILCTSSFDLSTFRLPGIGNIQHCRSSETDSMLSESDGVPGRKLIQTVTESLRSFFNQ
jgi:hypothetical protein